MDKKWDTSKEIRSIIFAFTVVFVFFSGVFILKYFDGLNFDNVIVLMVFVFSISTLFCNIKKKDTDEIIDFKEPKI